MASSRFVRQSKVRHVYGDQWKAEQCYSELRLATATGDQSYIKANSKFFAVAVRGGGGPLLVHPLSSPGRVPHDAPVLSGHKGNVVDFDFNPFNDHMIASGADDCTIKIWGIPEGGLTENVTEPLNELLGHDRKVGFVLFHPTASNVLASASADHTVRIWDIEEGETKFTLSDFTDQIQDLKWNHNGSMMATTCRDKLLRIHDVRASAVAQQVEAHEGGKAFKTTFLGDTGRMVTVGFTKQSKRQVKLWDARDLTTAVTTVDIDQAAGTILPFYDQSTDLLYLAGKGDNTIRYYEVVNEAPFLHLINSVRTPSSAKGSALLPKRAVDVSKNEIARFVRLGSRGAVDVVSMICPRKSDHFQADLYPPAYAGVPALSAEAWFGGADAEPKTVSMEPGAASAGAGAGAAAAAGSPMKSRSQLQKELAAANARIRELEEELAALRG